MHAGRRSKMVVALASVAAVALAACGGGGNDDAARDEHEHTAPVVANPTDATTASAVSSIPATSAPAASTSAASLVRQALPGMPPVLDPTNVYSATMQGLTGAAAQARELVYVPHDTSNDVWVIDPKTFKVIDKYATGAVAQHVVPSWDLKTLYVNNNNGNTLTPIDPTTGKPKANIPINDPYNLYFTPDGKYALVMEERDATIAWRDMSSPLLTVMKRLTTPCVGPNHADFSPDGTFFLVSCEFSGDVLKIDTQKQAVVGKVTLTKKGAKPQDTRLMPDGKTFIVADMVSNGVWEINGEDMTIVKFIPTGPGAHGIYPNRDASVMIVTNRGNGSISILDSVTRQVINTWQIPGGGSPDMGDLSTDGTQFWVSGRSHDEVYVIDVTNPRALKLITKIKVGKEPHGLAYWPQPGRYSLGHTGNMR
ncbi:MAG: hypothetical protein AB7L13_07800 [Acidimicrobiia bacterium]